MGGQTDKLVPWLWRDHSQLHQVEEWNSNLEAAERSVMAIEDFLLASQAVYSGWIWHIPMSKPWSFATGRNPRSSEAGVWENLRLQDIYKSYLDIFSQFWALPKCWTILCTVVRSCLQSNIFANLLQCRNRSHESGSCRSWRRRSTPAHREACSSCRWKGEATVNLTHVLNFFLLPFPGTSSGKSKRPTCV